MPQHRPAAAPFPIPVSMDIDTSAASPEVQEALRELQEGSQHQPAVLTGKSFVFCFLFKTVGSVVWVA